MNGEKYGHSYYGRQIGNRTKAFGGTSLNDLLFKVTILQRQIT